MLLLFLHVKYNVIKTINNPTLCCPKSQTPFTNAVCGRVFDNSMQTINQLSTKLANPRLLRNPGCTVCRRYILAK